MAKLPKRSVQAFFRRLEKAGQIELAEGAVPELTEAFRDLLEHRRIGLDGPQFAGWLLEQDQVEDVFAEDAELTKALEELASRGTAKNDAPSVVARSPELEAGIAEHPDDPGAYLVYADWLQEQGDSLGTFVALGAQADAGDEAAQKQFAKELKRGGVLGRLASYVPRTIALQWRNGFVHGIQLGKPAARGGYETSVMLELTLALRICQFVQRMTVCPFRQRESATALLPLIAKAELPVLRDLSIRGFQRLEGFDQLESMPRLRSLKIEMRDRGVLTLETVPSRVESLAIETNELQLPKPDLEAPSVTQLEIVGDHPGAAAKWLERGRFPKLRELVFDGAFVDCSMADLSAWLGRRDAPKLTSLTMRRTESTAHLLARLIESRWGSELTHLSVADGDLKPADLHKLAPGMTALSKLESLDLRGNSVAPADIGPFERAGLEIDVDAPDRPGSLTPGQIRVFADDMGCHARALKITHPKHWDTLGREGEDRWWGRFGKGYAVYLSSNLAEYGCSCPSPDDPCKHVVALAMVAARRAIPEAAMPSGFQRSTSRGFGRYDGAWE